MKFVQKSLKLPACDEINNITEDQSEHVNWYLYLVGRVTASHQLCMMSLDIKKSVKIIL